MRDITIRNLNPNEMGIALTLLYNEGWNPSQNDPDIFYRIDKNGYFVAAKDNEVAGIISAINYDSDFGFIGMHIVRPQFSSNLLKDELLDVAKRKLGNISIGLNSFQDDVKYYLRFGFKPEHKIATYKGIADGTYNVPQDIVSPLMFSFEDFLEYDRKVFPYERKYFLNIWLNQPGSLLLAKYSNNNYKGYGLFRPCVNGYKISPLIADNFEFAEEILISLLSHFDKGTVFYLDIPEKNKDAIQLVEKLNMEKINETMRMYSGGEVKILVNNVFGFNSFELG